MILPVIEALLRNALLLFALVFVYGAINVKPNQKNILKSVVLGLMIGGFAVLVMMNPWVMEQGLIFDTRSVLISVTAAFFSPLTTLVAAAIGITYRIIVGGAGVYAGVGTYVVSVSIGFLWRYLRYQKMCDTRSPNRHLSLFFEFIAFGFVVNSVVVICQIFLIFPYWNGLVVANGIALPFLVFYPIVTGILAIALVNQIDRLNANAELAETQKMLQSLIDSPRTMGIYAVDTHYHFLAFNAFFHEFALHLSGTNIQIGGDASLIFSSGKELSEWKTEIGRALTGEAVVVIRENIAGIRYMRMISAPIYSVKNVLIGATVFFSDVTLEVAAAEENKYLSYHDYLTGLYNRRQYNETMNEMDQDRSIPISVVEGDINGLKLVNDAFGHAAGDELLIHVSNTLNKFFSESRGVIRMGGDEFVVFLPNKTLEETNALVEAIKADFEKTILYGMPISVSFGVGTRAHGEAMSEVIKRAEVEMYNKKLFEVTSQRAESIKSILNTLYVKNPREEIHSQRVSEICTKIGEMYHLPKDQISMLRLIGNLHDIGKIAIDESILNKPGRLDPFEWEIIRRHPEIGYRILASSGEYAEMSEDILAHHEHWDGSGYPKGLAGEKIPWRARVIAVADAFDAMTAPRTYRKVLSIEEALEEISRCAGTQFDPEIAEKFVEEMKKEH